MTQDESVPPNTPIKVPRHLDRMVASGRITSEEAELLTATEPEQASATISGIRARHAGAVLDSAVAAGQVARSEADELLGRIRAGDHSVEVRARVNRFRQAVRRRRTGGTQTPEGDCA